MTNKYKLTTTTKQHWDITLYQIQALKDFWNIKKGALWWWIEKEDNLSQDWNALVSWDARVYWNALVYWNAKVSWAYNYTRWWFIWWDNSGKITDITDKMWSTYWSNQYVLWDYEITPIEGETS